MAAIDHSAYAPSTSVGGFGATISRGVSELVRTVRTFVVYRQTLESLNNLSRRQLEDIGLDGANVDVLAYDMAQRAVR